LNFAGKSGSHADFGASAPHGHIDSLSKGADTVTVPDAHLLFSGDYARSGADLIISDQLHRVVVPNYFNGDKRPALVSAQGAPIDPKFIDALTGHVQYAQAAGTAAAPKVIGHVVKMTGSASIVRNGVTIDVNNGDNVYQSDVVQTGSGSTLGLVMIDGTTFNLTANARLMMNDLTYDATSTSNTSLFTLVQGAATFVAGQVAKTGDMKVSTPVATMGIRGTAVILDVSSTDGTVSVSVVNQRDGQIHAVQVFNARGDLIGMVTSNGLSLTLTPTATFEVIAQESNKTVAQVLTEFNAFQLLLSTYEIAKQLFPNTPFPTDGRRGDADPRPVTKFAGSSSSPGDTSPVKNNGDGGGAKDGKGDGTVDPVTGKPTGEITDPKTKIAFNSGDDAPTQFVDVAATSIPFVVTPSPVSRISSGPGDHFGPAMSADGQFVTYDPDGAIYLFDRQTGATKTIASPGGGLTYGSPAISSDGHFIVYQGSDGTQSWIFIYNNDASDPTHYGQITRLMSGGQPAISGDGSKIVVERGGSIGLYDQQGHELASFTAAAIGATGTLWKPAISADGHIIAFWSSDLSSTGGAGQLFTYDLSTATIKSIASTATDAGNSAASFSADGHYVVYQSDTLNGHSEIYLYDLRAGQVVFHTANPDPSYNPVLSPDGHFIIFASDAKLTDDDKNAFTDIYVIDVTDPSHPAYKLVSVLDDGTQGDAPSNLGAAISAGGQFIAFGSRASNFSTGDGPGSGDIFVVDPTSGHSAIILESHNSPAVLTTSGVIKLTGEHSGITLGVSDSRITASFDSHGDIRWSFSEPRSDFASLQPGQISVQNFVITLSTDRSTTEIPLKVSIYDVDQTAVPVADAAPVASPVTLAAGTEDTGYTITSAALLAGVVDIDGPSLSINAVGILSGGGAIVDNHDGTFHYTPAPNYNGPVVFSYTASDGTLSASSTATLNVAAVNDAPVVAAALTSLATEGGSPVTLDLLTGASDVDGGTLAVAGLLAPQPGLSLSGSVLTIDPTNILFDHLANGATQTITLHYSIVDGQGGVTPQTAEIKIFGTNDAPLVSPGIAFALEGGPAVTVTAFFAALDLDDGTILSVTGLPGVLPDGVTFDSAAQSFTFDPTNAAYRHLSPFSSMTVTVNYAVTDGIATTADSVTFTVMGTNDAPVITNAGLSISEGGTLVLTSANIGVTDPDSASFTFTASGVTHGTFQTTTDGANWIAATTFTTADLNAGHVRFVHDGGEAAPTFSIRADDGAALNHASTTISGTVDFANVNDAPRLVSASINVIEGGAVVLDPARIVHQESISGTFVTIRNPVFFGIGVDDPDSSSFTFTVSNVTHGAFQTTADGTHWSDATKFTSADLNAGHVRFLENGDDAIPGFSIQADDGAAVNNLSNVLAGSVSLFGLVNDTPVLTKAVLAVAEGGTTVLDAASIGVSDPDNTSFTFAVSNVSHGTFETMADGTNWAAATTFTTADLNAGHVRFVHDGGEDAPAFSIQANDGAGSNSLSNVLAGSVTFTNVNDAPVIDSRPISEIAVINSGDILAFTGQLVGRSIGILSGDGHGGFTPVVVVGVSNSLKPLEASLGDVNGDGIPDVVVRDDSVLSIHMADGAGGFSPAVSIATGISAFKLIDINGDGSLDIITSDPGGKTSVLAGDGHGGFSPVTAGANLPGPGFQTADVNGDGFLDSVSGNNSTVRVQLGDGHGGFSSPATFANGIDASHLTLGDVNGDGAVDIVTVSATFDPIAFQLGAKVSVLFGDGGGSFSTPDFLDPGGINPTAIALADLNHDGAADIITADPTRNRISIISSDGHGGFLQPVALTDGLSGPNSVAVADVTGDGILDIIVTDDHGNIDLIAGDGHGGFLPTVKFPSGGNIPAAIDLVEVSGAGPLHYIENQSPRRIDPGLTISDVDSQNVISATVSIANNFHAAEDSLGFTDQNGIHGSYNSATGVLTLSGVSSVANYQAALRSVTYFNGSDDPSGATRTIAYQVDDGSSQNHSSNIFTATIDVIPADDAPAITRASLTISQGHTVTVTTADIDFVDPDSPVVTYTVSSLSHGHFETGFGNDAIETETFTSADVVAGLVSFVDEGSSGTPTFSLTPNDGSIDGATVNGVVTFSATNYTMTSTEGVIINVTPEGATSGFVFPGAGNVTTPGIPEDRIAIGYDVGRSHVVLDNAPLLGVHQMTSLSSETHSSGGTTFVSTTLDAGHDVTLVQTLALGSDANFFTTTIDITNNGATDISNLRFLRNFDPDQDVQAHNDYRTFNDVVQNPDGAETFAILSATGVESHTKVAMIGLGPEWRASVFGFTNTDPYALHAFDQPTIPNSAVPVDLSLSLTSGLGTLTAHGGHAEVTYITTNNVATSGSNALYGTAGADTINGLGGDDLLIGLKGADTFVFNAAASGGSGHDTIADFTPGQDRISLDYHAFDAAAGPNDFSNWLRTHGTNSGNDVLIDLNVDGLHPGVDTILLKNVASASLQAGDFHTL
jgi:Tol biopolymer transport system component